MQGCQCGTSIMKPSREAFRLRGRRLAPFRRVTGRLPASHRTFSSRQRHRQPHLASHITARSQDINGRGVREATCGHPSSTPTRGSDGSKEHLCNL